ncbi:MAG TPA: FMN-binding protein [Acholeplasmataceae bacterium]|nr:FMN-binding protein [Acholeplasmataceae bacterium]HRX45488.1 FMN-binding protein [Acholeplasmataceae bacterium]
MKKNLQLILFVLILGGLTSGLLVGVDLLTSERIAQNEMAQLKAAILDANDISYNSSNIHDVFDEKIEIIEIEDFDYQETSDGDAMGSRDYVFYRNEENGNISFEFIGGGLWGDIAGVITLDDEMDTIVSLVVLQQQETPGLGGIVAEENYLAQFVGIKMTPEIEINKDSSPNKPNEVDAITGATGTSNAFQRILRLNYRWYMAAWESRNE